MLTRDQAWEKVTEWIKNPNLRKHCLAVEAAMLAYADKYDITDDVEKEKWAIAGLIHDADWEKWPDLHPQKTIEWLKEIETEEDLINAVASHGANLGIEPQTQMARVLRAVDELTGFIVAVTLVHPNKKLREVNVDSILSKSKWGSKRFAQGVNRQEIETAAKELGVELEDHIQMVLSAMQKISKELGL